MRTRKSHDEEQAMLARRALTVQPGFQEELIRDRDHDRVGEDRRFKHPSASPKLRVQDTRHPLIRSLGLARDPLSVDGTSEVRHL